MFKGYKVLITGATGGMGLATAKEFIAQGATVIGLGRNFERTKELGQNFIPFKCDVTDESQIIAAREFVEKEFGMLDTLILNAGTPAVGTPADIVTENLDYIYKVHYRQNVLFVRELAPLLEKSKNPSVSFTCSCAAFQILDTGFDYANMKSATTGFCRMAANVFDGIRFNSICPGLIRTNLLPDAAWNAFENDEKTMETIPARRIGEDWEIAKLFAFLASEEASYVNGAVILIDGGWNVTHPRNDILK